MGAFVNLEQTRYGYEMRTSQITVFMGGVQAQMENLRQEYSGLDLIRVKQIHSDVVVEVD